jgi:hypothetical protein
MTKSKFTTASFFIRLAAAIALVFVSFNPLQPYSYYYWAIAPLLSEIDSFSIVKGLAGIVLLIGWSIFIRATLRSLGPFGTLLAVLFFGLLLWLVVDLGIFGEASRNTITWLILLGLAGVLAAGISWSHIRRRMTGQLDVDETDD